VVAAVDVECDTAEMIRQAKCGLVVPPADDKALAHAILYYYQNPKDRELAAQAGREYFMNNLERKKVIPGYLDLIEGLSKA
jgi:glycosyltransferase involved in cell wall biosynthesis